MKKRRRRRRKRIRRTEETHNKDHRQWLLKKVVPHFYTDMQNKLLV